MPHPATSPQPEVSSGTQAQPGARPLLVLVHGTRFDARSWHGYAQLLPQADVVAVDLPGHGRRAGAPYTTDAALEVIDEVVRAAGAGRPVVLAGHSLGGYAVAAYAQRHPRTPAALVLIGAAAQASRHRVLTGVYSGFARLLPLVGAERMARGANAVITRLGADPAGLPGSEAYAVLPQAWAVVIAEAGVHQLEQVSCPVYLVGGQFDQLRIDTAAYAAACADARVRVIPRASHLAPLTHRAEVAAVLAEAVAQVARVAP